MLTRSPDAIGDVGDEDVYLSEPWVRAWVAAAVTDPDFGAAAAEWRGTVGLSVHAVPYPKGVRDRHLRLEAAADSRLARGRTRSEELAKEGSTASEFRADVLRDIRVRIGRMIMSHHMLRQEVLYLLALEQPVSGNLGPTELTFIRVSPSHAR